MINSRTVFAGLLSSAIFSSCGMLGQKKKDSNDDVQSPQLIAAKDLMILSPEDPACMAGNSSTAIKNAQVWLWDGTSVAPKTVAINGTIGSDQELVSSGTLGAIWNYQFTRDCTYESGAISCGKANVTHKNEIVKFCRQDGVYGRESIESMTLTTQYMSDMTRTFYYKLKDSTPGLLQAVLNIQPQELWSITRKSDGKHVDKMLGDNASFAASAKSEFGIFNVYPTSKSSFAESPVHLWEAPFVMRHEFGHNVFHHHLGSVLDDMSLDSMDSELSFGIMRNPPTYRSASFSLDEKSQVSKDLSGVNETFADLFAYYGGDAAPGQLKGLTSLDTTRDPASSKTKGGTKKAWTSKESSIYKGILKPANTDDASEPDFTDSHDVAAVFGYNFAKLIDASLTGKTSVEKANLLLLWANNLATHLTAKGSSADLDSMTVEFVKVVMAAKTGDMKAACADFAANMSGLTNSIAACK